MTFVQSDEVTWPDQKKTLRCCDIWDTDYNTDNWEPEFMTIFVTWQLQGVSKKTLFNEIGTQAAL